MIALEDEASIRGYLQVARVLTVCDERIVNRICFNFQYFLRNYISGIAVKVYLEMEPSHLQYCNANFNDI